MDIPQQQPDTLAQYRLTGEDTPIWLLAGFGVIGALLASAAAWLWMIGQTQLQEQPVQGIQIQHQAPVTAPQATVSPPLEEPAPPAVGLPLEQPAPPAVTPIPSTPVPMAGETPEITVLAEGLPDIQAEAPAPQPPDAPAAAVPADADDAPENTVDQPSTPVATPSPGTLTECPPAINVPFTRGSAKPAITSALQLPLEELRRWLDDQPKAKLSVEGHADSAGSERSNLLISYRRAKAVAALLSEAGIARERMVILAFGEHDPIAGIPGDSDDNRRVLLQVKGFENCQAVSTDRE